MCPECDYSTVYSGLMDEHISSHYADPDPTEGVQEQRNEKFSMKEHHPWNYECSPCGVKFVKEEDMLSHFTKIHPDSEISKHVLVRVHQYRSNVTNVIILVLAFVLFPPTEDPIRKILLQNMHILFIKTNIF